MLELVRFNLYIDKEQLAALERLQVLTGKKTLEETIMAALKVYGVVVKSLKTNGAPGVYLMKDPQPPGATP